MKIIIKQAIISDRQGIAEVFIEAFNSLGENWNLEHGAKYVDYMFKHQADMLFVAKDGERVVGAIWGIIKPFDKCVKVVDIELFVSFVYRKKGISLMLYEKFLDYAVEKYGVSEMEGSVLDKPGFPMSYYESLCRYKTGWIVLGGDVSLVLENVRKGLFKHGN